MKTSLLVSILLALGGCATCQQHPTACAIGSAIVVGSIVYTMEMNDSQHRQAQPAAAVLPKICLHGGFLGGISVTCP
jgi:hypothetical protein